MLTLEKPSRVSPDDDEYMLFVRGLSCCLCLDPPRNDCAHVQSHGAFGPVIANTIPLCRVCHTNLHRYGNAFVQKFMGVDFSFIADSVYELWIHRNRRKDD